jgi:hypothetical protein
MNVRATGAPDKKITREDIESKLKELQGGVGQQTEAAKMPAFAVVVGVVIVSIAAAYLLGRRKGKRRATVLEIRRL